MENKRLMYYSNGSYCASKSDFEDWETKFTPGTWESSDLFTSLKDCCVTKFWYDIKGCVEASPKEIDFSFSIEVENIVLPGTCQDADAIAQGLENAIDIGLGEHGKSRITQIGCATLDLNPNTYSSECGGCLSGSYIDGYSEIPDDYFLSSTSSTTVAVLVNAKQFCADTACLQVLYDTIVANLIAFVNSGDLTSEIVMYSSLRQPPIPELLNVQVVASSFTTSGEYTNPFTQPDDLNGQALMLYYPNFDDGNNRCAADGYQKNYMNDSPEYFLFSSEEECCQEWFYYNKDCSSSSSGSPTNEVFVPDWYTSVCSLKDESLVDSSLQLYTFTSSRDCCSAVFEWNYKACCRAAGGC